MIQSISDIITNSSSEVFIIDTNEHEKIKEFLTDVCQVFGWDINDLMYFETAESNGEVEGWDISYKQGNLLIWSTDDNSIPDIIMDIIRELEWDYIPTLRNVAIIDVKRHHLG